MKKVGIVLLLLGLLITITTGLQITMRDLGEVESYQISNSNKMALYWSPITALSLLTAGIIVLVIARKENRIINHQ